MHAGIFMIHGDSRGAAVFPDPNDENEHASYVWRWQGSVFTSVVNDRSQAVHLQLDLRSQRKYPSEDHELVFLIESSVSAITVNVDGLIRTLWKLA